MNKNQLWSLVFTLIFMISCVSSGGNSSGSGADEIILINFDEPTSVIYEPTDANVALVQGSTGNALKMDFHNAINPKVLFGFDSPMDWNNKLVAFDVHNPSDKPVRFYIRVDSGESPDGQVNTNSFVIDVVAGGTEEVILTFLEENTNHGMQAFGNFIQSSWGHSLEMDHIIALQIWQWEYFREFSLVVDNFRLIERDPEISLTTGLVDEFGQNAKVNYPGKIKSEKKLCELSAEEEAKFLIPGEIEGRSTYGGHLDESLRQEPTGYFHTSKIEEKWWIIDPEGYPYLSFGLDIIRTGDSYTMLSSREDMYNWLPDAEGNLGSHYSYAGYVLKGAVPKGVIYNFYTANLERKYGSDWFDIWKDTAIKRSATWGFTSFGNWSDPEFWGQGEENRMPYVADGWIPMNHKTLSSGSDYWGEMHDPFDPAFRENVKSMVHDIAEKVADDPWCMGVFVDNEMSWGNPNTKTHYGLIFSAFLYVESISEVKQVFMSMLTEKYATIEDLNISWGTALTSWDRLRESFNAEYYFSSGMEEDFSKMLEVFANQYYSIVQEELKKAMPNHMYLGCRMADWAMPPEVIRSAAKYTDIISFNWYHQDVDPQGWNWKLIEELDRPVIIGEFHFGATDAGHYGGGIVKVPNQESRGESYKKYITSVLNHSNIVGAHWFQYMDEPITGRAWDGENHNVGFVSVTDIPYSYLVEAAKEINFKAYEIRLNK